MNDLVPILDDLDLGSARGGRRSASGEPLICEVVRSLTEEDLPLLLSPPPIQADWKGPAKLRYTHHQLARLLAMGKSQTEASLISGFSQSFISCLVNRDKPFQSLLLYYKENAEAIFVDVAEKMRTLGLSALELLQEKIDEEPDGWTKGQLLELAETMLVKPMKGTNINIGGGSTGPNGLNIGITFVTPQQQEPKRSEGTRILEDVIDVLEVEEKGR